MLDRMTNVVQFKPKAAPDDGSWSDIEVKEYLAVLHGYLDAALIRQNPNGSVQVNLCVDDIALICELIALRVIGYLPDEEE